MIDKTKWELEATLNTFYKYSADIMKGIHECYMEVEEDMEEWQLRDLSYKLLKPYFQA